MATNGYPIHAAQPTAPDSQLICTYEVRYDSATRHHVVRISKLERRATSDVVFTGIDEYSCHAVAQALQYHDINRRPKRPMEKSYPFYLVGWTGDPSA